MYFRCGSFEFKVGGYDESERPAYIVDKPCALAMDGKLAETELNDPNSTERVYLEAA